jgi:2-polyprenyl-3-methyl-5-hydroxy-6-metoxy-1,4-benzoquinol methylase
MINHLESEKNKILKELENKLDKDLNLFMSTPNKLFRNRPPLELLNSNDFSYFYQFLNNDKVL